MHFVTQNTDFAQFIKNLPHFYNNRHRLRTHRPVAISPLP
jgi:hypothetical protein